MSIKLSQDNLSALASVAKIPGYDRRDLKAGIVHIGVGNFHRAHQAIYFDDLFGLGLDRDWAIVGAGVRDSDETMRQALLAQDLLTTVVEQETDHSAPRVTGAMIEFLKVGQPKAILDRLADPAIRIVSLTITEGGYYIDPASQAFNAAHPDILADAVAIGAPRTAFGLIVAGLIARRANGTMPFTVMSCDNLPGNGHVTEDAVSGLANLVDPTLGAWVKANVAFPNGMVDRITPATSDRERVLLQDSYGIVDARPVFCEAFRQWVLEDNFPAGRPALERVGVQFVADVAPFELMKIRILNGGHATIAYPAALLDIEFVHEAIQEPLIGRFLSKLLDDEIMPMVPPVPGTDLATYKKLIERRFANPKIGDTTRRLCLDGSNRQPKFILPSVSDRLQRGLPVDGLALVCALWCRYCQGETESGAAIAPNDPNWPRLQQQARAARMQPSKWLEMRDIFGDIANNDIYSVAFSSALKSLWQNGTRWTLTQYLEASPHRAKATTT
jgi:mannitol 2-dehydrogenase